MNILDKLPFLADTTEEEAAEYDEAQAKKDRIEFHRRSVRNGPTKFATVTNGQVKRAKVRALARDTKKARKRQIRQHLADQREGATIRGHLQAAGVLPLFGDYSATPQQVVRSLAWIVSRFADAEEGATIEVTHGVVVQSLTSALNRWQTIVGHPTTPLSPAYRLPVALPDGSVVDEA